MARTKARIKKSKLKKKSLAEQPVTNARRAGGIKVKLTKRSIIDKLVAAADATVSHDGTEITQKLSTADTRRVVTAVYLSLEEIIQKSIQPNSCGEFVFPGMFKINVRVRPAIRKGTMVRNPGTGQMQPSKGRPARKTVRLRPLVKLKRAAEGEL